jgi:hypothetical protein
MTRLNARSINRHIYESIKWLVAKSADARGQLAAARRTISINQLVDISTRRLIAKTSVPFIHRAFHLFIASVPSHFIDLSLDRPIDKSLSR